MTLFRDMRRVMVRMFEFWKGAIVLEPLSLKQVVIGISLISLVRTFADMLWVGSNPTKAILNFLIWEFYITSLCLFTAYLTSRLVPRTGFIQALTVAVCVYSLVPLVPLFSLLPLEKTWGLGMFVTIPFYEWIPTFTVKRNYLPLGMVVLSPVIFLMFARWLRHCAKASWIRALFVAFLVLFSVYVYYYQWIWIPSTIAFFDKKLIGLDAILAMVVTYSFLSQLVTLLLTPVLARSYGVSQRMLVGFSTTLLVLLLIIPRVGILSVWLP